MYVCVCVCVYFGFFVWRHINFRGLINAKDISIEEQ